MQQTCEHFELQMPDALTGQLEAAAQNGLQEHLAACIQCRSAFERFEKTAVLLNRSQADSESSELWLRIERTVSLGENRRAKLIRLNSPMAPFAVAAAMVAAALLLVVAMPPVSSRPVSNVKVAPVRPETPVVIASSRPTRESFDDSRGLALLRRMGPLAVFDVAHQAWRPIVPGERVTYGSRIRTGPGARAELAFGESRVRLDESSEVTISRAADRTRTADLAQGRVRVDLLRSDARFFMQSGGGRVELTGTIVELTAPAQRLAIAKILEGHVSVAPMIGGSNATRIEAQSGNEVLVAYDASSSAVRELPDPLQKRAQALAEAKERVLPAQNGESGNWTQPLDQPPPKSEASVGQLVVKDAQGHEAEPLGIVSFDIHANVRGPEALTRVEQVFKNETNSTLEGTFYFPLPPGAAISRFAMWVDEKTLVEGEVVERQQARAIYESILRQKRDPALLEWMEGNLFKARIFPIAPRSEKKIILEYTQLLPAFFETRSYVFPLVSELTQKTPIGRLSLRVDLDSGDGSVFSDVASPSYFAQTKVTGVQSSRVTASLEMQNLKPSADFVLTFSALRPSELAAAAYAEKDEDPYLLLAYQPQWQTRDNAAAQLPRDVLFVVETSGGRTTQDLETQRRVLEAMLAGLNANDRAAIAAADVALVPLSEELTPPHSRQNTAAFAALKSRVPLGALDLDAALRGAGDFLARESMAGRERFVIFLGAGVPALGTFDAGQLAANGAASLALAKAKFVAVGIGRSVETLTLSELARRSGGFFAPMLAEENGDEAAFRMALNLSSARLESAALKCDAAAEIYPAQLGALLPGQEVFAFTRLDRKQIEKGKPIAISASGQVQSQPFSQKMRVKLPADLSGDPAVGRFWARARMDALMAQPQNETVRTQIIDLAQTWTLLSPYTSFLVLESEAEYGRYNIDRKKRRKVWREVNAPVANAITEFTEENVGFRLHVVPKVGQDVKTINLHLDPISPTNDAELSKRREEDNALRGEVRMQAHTYYESGKALYSAFDYEGARLELELATRLDPNQGEARVLLTNVNDILKTRRDRVRSASSQLYGEMKIAVQEKLLELDNRIDWGKRYIHEAQTEPDLSLSERIRRYDQALNAFERARELLKWMPVEVSAGVQEEEVRRLIGETRKATKAAQTRLQETDREAAGRIAEEQRMSEKKYVEKKVRMMVDQAKTLFESGKYDDALTLAAKILETDPTNADANTIVAVSRDKHHAQKQKWLEQEYRESFTLNRERADRMNIPHSDYLIYPDNWKEIASRTVKEKASEGQAAISAASEQAYQEGLNALKELDYDATKKNLEKAVQLNPANADAQQKLRTVNALLGVNANIMKEKMVELERAERVKMSESMLSLAQALEDGRVLEEKGSAEVKEENVEQKQHALDERLDSLRRAQERYRRVREILNWMPPSFELPGMRTQIDAALQRTKGKLEAKEDEISFLRREEAARMAYADRRREDAQFKERVDKLMGQVDDLFARNDFRAAEHLAQSVLKIDPLNDKAEAMKKKARAAFHAKADTDVNELMKDEYKRSWEDVSEASINYTPLVLYPSNWDVVKRGEAAAVGRDVKPEAYFVYSAGAAEVSNTVELEKPVTRGERVSRYKATVDGTEQTRPELRWTNGIAADTGKPKPGLMGFEATREGRMSNQGIKGEERTADLFSSRLGVAEETQSPYQESPRAVDVTVSGELAILNSAMTRQQQAVEVERQIAAPARAEKIELERELNELKKSYMALQRDKQTVEQDLSLQTRRIEKLLAQNVPIAALLNEDPTATQPYIPDAQVLAVKPDTGVVMISAGSNQGVKPGYQFTISRGEQYVSKVQVDRVYPDMSSAKTINGMQKREVEVHDRADTVGNNSALVVERNSDNEIRRKLQKKISFEFVDTPLDEAASFLRAQIGVTIIVDPRVMANKRDAITLRVHDMEADLALKWILRLSDLDYVLRDGALFITTKESLSSATEPRGERTAIVPLTREQILQLLKLTPKTEETAQTRVQLVCTLASVSEGAEVYRVFVTGIADFGGSGQHAERLAQEFLNRLKNETSKAALDAALKFVEDSGLRARMFARRANLESDAAQRSDFFQRAYFESEREIVYLQPLCESLLAAQRFKALSDYIEDALRRGAGASWQWPLLAKAYDAQKLPQQALRALTQDAALRPREPEPRMALAKTFDGLGRGAEALRELRAACDLKPEVVGGYRELLVLAKKYGDASSREWALLKMLNGTWLSTDGNVWGEAQRGLEELSKEYDSAAKSDAAAALREAIRQAKIKDIEVVLSWDTDGTDVDLHVAEPGGMEVNYQRKSSPRGGVLDRDETNGRGPETYTLKRAEAGTYAIKVVYYNGTKPTLASVKVTEKAGSPGEKSQTFTIPLEKSRMEKDVYTIKIEGK